MPRALGLLGVRPSVGSKVGASWRLAKVAGQLPLAWRSPGGLHKLWLGAHPGIVLQASLIVLSEFQHCPTQRGGIHHCW